MVAHNKPGKRTSWVHHGTLCWHIGKSLEHYIFIQCYITETSIVRITYTLQYIPKAFTVTKTTTEDYLQQAIGDIISIMKKKLKTLPFLSYGDATKYAIHKIAYILQRITYQPHIQILLLPPMLPQSQNENLQPPKITIIPAPYPRVELVLQPPRVQAQDSEPTSTPR